jgi:hypothetical protein
MHFSKESIVFTALFLSIIIVGSYAYIVTEKKHARLLQMYSSAVTNLPACIPKTNGNTDDAEVLRGIIAWGETMAPRTENAAKSATDPLASKLLAEEAKRLRQEVAQAKNAYQEITGKPYAASNEPLWFYLPPEDTYGSAEQDMILGLFRGNINFAQREIYLAASASQNPTVRDIGKDYLGYVEGVFEKLSSNGI